MVKNNEIGKYIPDYLRKHNMTVDEFGFIIGAGKSSIYNWISGKGMLPVYYNQLLIILKEVLPEKSIEVIDDV